MKKKNIVRKKSDFSRIIKTTKPIVSKFYVIYIERTNDPEYHFGISVSKKLGKAVLRNKLKRQLKYIIDKKDYQKGFNCIIILRKSVLNANFTRKQEELEAEFTKLCIYKEDKNV